MSDLIFKLHNRLKLNVSDFENVDIRGLDFVDAILPKDRMLFQKIKNKDLSMVKLPFFDMNEYDFLNVNLTGCIFNENTIFSDDFNFFQKIKKKSLNFVTLPIHDYSLYDFTGVSMIYTVFRDGSIILSNADMLMNLSVMSGVGFSKEFKDVVHLYNFNSNLYERFIQSNSISLEQHFLIRNICDCWLYK